MKYKTYAKWLLASALLLIPVSIFTKSQLLPTVSGLLIIASLVSYTIYLALIARNLYRSNADKKDIDYDDEIHLDVVGESFDNDDGTSRQEIIEKHVKVGTPVEFRFYAFKGQPACAVLVDGKQIGNIAKKEVKSLRDILSSASAVDARVDSVGVSRQSGLYGVSLMIRAAQ